MTDRGSSFGLDERPQQLDNLLRVPPALASAGPVAKPVHRLVDLDVRHALHPQVHRRRQNLGVVVQFDVFVRGFPGDRRQTVPLPTLA
jgi:hypothetical protein